jgi:hypothetical protein
MKKAMLAIQGKDTSQALSANPISKEEAAKGIEYVKETLKDVPEELRQKLRDPDVVVLGVGINPLWNSHRTGFQATDVLEELNHRLDLDDEAIRLKDRIQPDRTDAAEGAVSSLVLTYGMMNALGIDRVRYVGAPGGNAIGALLSPKYWEKR